MSFLPLVRLLTVGRAPDHPVALRDGVPIRFSRLRADVAATAIPDAPAIALACTDLYCFAVGLLALLHAGRDVWLPANTQPGTIAELGIPVLHDDAIGIGTEARPIAPITGGRFFLRTSGSTGAPKCIDKSLAMLDAEAAMLHRVWGASSGPVLGTVSHQHMYGLAFRLLWPLAAGVPFDAATDTVWETLLPKLSPGAVVVSSPAHLGRLGGIAAVPQPPSLVFSAGAPLPARAAAEAHAILGCLPTEIFGSTETGAIATRRQHEPDPRWMLLPDTEIQRDAQGRMQVRSPQVTGWQQTEDLIEPSPHGFRYLGRADAVVKIEGQRVSLPEIETALTGLDWVADAVVVPLAGQLGAALVLSDQGRINLRSQGTYRLGRQLRRALTAHFEPAGLPRLWRFVDAVPRRAMGKPDHVAIRALFDA